MPSFTRPALFRLASVLVAATAAVAGLAACGGDSEPTSLSDALAEAAGHQLSPAEVAQQEEVASLLCGLDDQVLTAIWRQLDQTQLTFQDVVFTRVCPERNALYGEKTGRFDGATD